MIKECTCALGANECTSDSGIFYPLQAGGMCAAYPCQQKEHRESLERSTANMLDIIQKIKNGEML